MDEQYQYLPCMRICWKLNLALEAKRFHAEVEWRETSRPKCGLSHLTTVQDYE
ncbi:hypothetical protein AVEN_273292-1, partial [Araneus ventricosus]